MAPPLEPATGDRCSPRCGRCALPPDLCLCAEVKALWLATRVLVFLHRREVHKPTNTARMVPIALSNSEVRVVGREYERERYANLTPPGGRALLLFPSSDSVELTKAGARELCYASPLTLVVPDGNWRQARKIALHEEGLALVPRVHLPTGPRSELALRAHPDPGRISTFEAIARALGILEGEAVQQALERALALKVERTRWTRKRPKKAEIEASALRPVRDGDEYDEGDDEPEADAT